MDKSFAINNLRRSGYSERRIAETLGVSRGAICAPLHSNGTKAPTGSGGQTPTLHEASNSTKAPTGSEANPDVQNTTIPHDANCSHCKPFRDLIVAKFNLGLTAKRIHQDLVAEHVFGGKYWSVNRFVRALESTQEPPFRRMEVQPGEELQGDFGTGAKIRSEQGTWFLSPRA
jgi:hypothetical protein